MAMDAAYGAASAGIGTAVSYGINRAAANQAWKRQKKVLQNKIQWSVADMKAAGLNPILAAGSAFGGGAPSVAMPQIGDLGQAGATGAKASMEAARNKSVIDVATTQANANSATANLANANRARTNLLVQVDEAQKGAFSAQALASREQALRTANETEIIKARLPEAQAISEMWSDPAFKRAMQIKHFFSGGPSIRPPAGSFKKNPIPLPPKKSKFGGRKR